MKILYLSDGGLPDWRIEKSGITGLKNGHEVFFAGGKSTNYTTKVFSRVYEVSWSRIARYGIPYYWHCVKKQLAKVLRDSRPDIVHAHNIFSAKMISEFDIPFVYDDHEYWPIWIQLQIESTSSRCASEKLGDKLLALGFNIARNVCFQHAARLWTKWERDIVSAHPTITVSNEIAKELQSVYGCHYAFVVSNFPMASETSNIKSPQPHDVLSSVYAGIERHIKYFRPAHRNLNGLTDIFNAHDIGNLIMIGSTGESSGKVRYTGVLSREDMYSEMFKHSIGLLPWKRHASHKFMSPNKAYEYAHGGLLVLCMSSLRGVLDVMRGNCVAVNDYVHVVSELEYFGNNKDELYRKRLASYNFAKENLVWERDESKIINAYQVC